MSRAAMVWVIGLSLAAVAPSADAARVRQRSQKASSQRARGSTARAPAPSREKAPSRLRSAAVPVTAKLGGPKIENPISNADIARHVQEGFTSYLKQIKRWGPHTIASWNRLDPNSVVVKSVTIESFGYYNKGERGFTALVEVNHRSKDGVKSVKEIQVKSFIQLEKTPPKEHYGLRVRTGRMTTMRAVDTNYLNDHSTVGWID